MKLFHIKKSQYYVLITLYLFILNELIMKNKYKSINFLVMKNFNIYFNHIHYFLTYSIKNIIIKFT